MKENILVTGASGFVAENLIPELISKNYSVYGVDRKSKPSARCTNFISKDIVDLETDFLIENNISKVIHLAAARADWGIQDDEFIHDNVTASKALIACIKNSAVKDVIFVSSISVMPQASHDVIDETAPYDPINIYGETKKKAELLFIDLFNQELNQLNLTIIRPTVLYGPSNPNNTGMYRAVDNNIFRLIDGIYSNRFAIVGDGNTVKTTAYVKNFVDSILFSLERSQGYKLYVYADHPPLIMKDLVTIIRTKLKKKGDGLKLPFIIIRPISKLLDILSKITKINFPITQARIDTFVRPTNFRPTNLINDGFKQRTDTNEALNKTIEWYLDLKQNHKNNFFLFKDGIEK